MDGRTGLVVVCLVAGGAWALLVLALLVGRARHRRRTRPLAIVTEVGEWKQPPAVTELVDLGDTDGRAAEALLYQSLRSDIPELRTASVTALASLADRHDWAIDGLVEALAEASENPVRVAGELDRLAPRPGPRLPPLLGHPNPVVRSYAVRLLSRYPGARGAARPCLHVGPVAERPRRRARDASGGGLDRCAPSCAPASRRSASAGAGTGMPHRCRSLRPRVGAYLVPLLADTSWWVREAAREALVTAGDHATVRRRAGSRQPRPGAAERRRPGAAGHRARRLPRRRRRGRPARADPRRGRRTASRSRRRARTERASSSATGARSRRRPPRDVRDRASSRPS